MVSLWVLEFLYFKFYDLELSSFDDTAPTVSTEFSAVFGALVLLESGTHAGHDRCSNEISHSCFCHCRNCHCGLTCGMTPRLGIQLWLYYAARPSWEEIFDLGSQGLRPLARDAYQLSDISGLRTWPYVSTHLSRDHHRSHSPSLSRWIRTQEVSSSNLISQWPKCHGWGAWRDDAGKAPSDIGPVTATVSDT